MEYVPPFHFKLNEDGTLVKDQAESASPMLVLVLKQVALQMFRNKRIFLFIQEGRVWSEETHAGCDRQIVERMFDYRELAKKYNLEVVAGNFFQVSKFSLSELSERIKLKIHRCPGVGFGLKR